MLFPLTKWLRHPLTDPHALGQNCGGFFFSYLFYFWLFWVLAAMHGFSLIVVTWGLLSSCGTWASGWLLLLWSMGSRARGLSCYAACGIFPDQGWNPCALQCQADSYPVYHQGSPVAFTKHTFIWLFGSQLQHGGSLVVAFKLLIVACGVQFPKQGSNPGPLHQEHGVLATGPPRKSQFTNILLRVLYLYSSVILVCNFLLLLYL